MLGANDATSVEPSEDYVLLIGSENLPAIPLDSTLEQTLIPSTEKGKR